MNKNNSNIEDDLLIRFVQGDVAPEEQALIENWLSDAEENQKYFDKLKTVWKGAESIRVFDQIDVDKNWAEVKAKLNLDDNQKSKQVFMLPKLMRYAAAIVLIAAATFLITKYTGEATPEMLTITANVDMQYELPDGSDVWLKSGAELLYPSAFSSSERRIELKGQAFFEVEHDADHPFIVESGATETRVLGTSFNLKGDNAASTVELVLVTGKVAFKKGNQEVLLLPGEKVTVDEQGKLLKEENTNKNFMAWRTRTLVFENTRMDQVMKDIADLYGVTITFEQSSFKTCPLTTRFEDETLGSVLETIKLLFGVEMEQNGKNYTVKGSGC